MDTSLSLTVPLIHLLLEDGPRAMPEGSTLADLVAALGHAEKAVTTSVDGQFVPRSQWPAHRLRDGACVLFFKPIVGG